MIFYIDIIDEFRCDWQESDRQGSLELANKRNFEGSRLNYPFTPNILDGGFSVFAFRITTVMNRRNILATLAVALFGLGGAQASTASAQGYLYNGNLGWPNGFYQDERIPYFSLHPPVYYSAPVPRTYGWSPWAYPPGVQTPEIAECEPLMIENPHIESSSSNSKPSGVQSPKPATDRSASYRAANLIHNPYFEPQVAGE